MASHVSNSGVCVPHLPPPSSSLADQFCCRRLPPPPLLLLDHGSDPQHHPRHDSWHGCCLLLPGPQHASKRDWEGLLEGRHDLLRQHLFGIVYRRIYSVVSGRCEFFSGGGGGMLTWQVADVAHRDLWCVLTWPSPEETPGRLSFARRTRDCDGKHLSNHRDLTDDVSSLVLVPGAVLEQTQKLRLI